MACIAAYSVNFYFLRVLGCRGRTKFSMGVSFGHSTGEQRLEALLFDGLVYARCLLCNGGDAAPARPQLIIRAVLVDDVHEPGAD